MTALLARPVIVNLILHPMTNNYADGCASVPFVHQSNGRCWAGCAGITWNA